MNDLTLAVCMYNAEKYIEETLRCIMAQTMQDFDLLIVDDNSTDQSLEKVKNYFQYNPRPFKIEKLEQNKGIAFARNFALNTVDTKYLIFIDSDDLPLPRLLEKEYALLTSDQELMAVSSWSEFVDNQGDRIGGGLFIGDTDKCAFKQRAERNKLIFLPIQTMFERECAIKVGGFRCTGFPEGKPRYRDYCEDLDLWTRMSDLHVEGRAMIVIPEVLYQYRKTNSLSSNHFNMIIKMRYIKKNLLLRRERQKELTFGEFMNQMSSKEYENLKKESKAADSLRNGVFCFKERKFLEAVILILEAIWYKPTYIIEKLKYNSGLKRNNYAK